MSELKLKQVNNKLIDIRNVAANTLEELNQIIKELEPVGDEKKKCRNLKA